MLIANQQVSVVVTATPTIKLSDTESYTGTPVTFTVIFNPFMVNGTPYESINDAFKTLSTVTIKSDMTLTEDVVIPAGKKLIVDSAATLTMGGNTITISDKYGLENYGKIAGIGEITKDASSNGEIMNNGSVAATVKYSADETAPSVRTVAFKAESKYSYYEGSNLISFPSSWTLVTDYDDNSSTIMFDKGTKIKIGEFAAANPSAGKNSSWAYISIVVVPPSTNYSVADATIKHVTAKGVTTLEDNFHNYAVSQGNEGNEFIVINYAITADSIAGWNGQPQTHKIFIDWNGVGATEQIINVVMDPNNIDLYAADGTALWISGEKATA